MVYTHYYKMKSGVRISVPLLSDDLGGVCAALLESTGPQLIAHCVSKWLVESRVPADFVARLPSDPNDVQESDGGGFVASAF